MAAALNWNGRIVTSDGKTYAKAQLIVRGNAATVRLSPSNILEERAGVVAVLQGSDRIRERTVQFEDGSTWEILKSKGCNCR